MPSLKSQEASPPPNERKSCANSGENDSEIVNTRTVSLAPSKNVVSFNYAVIDGHVTGNKIESRESITLHNSTENGSNGKGTNLQQLDFIGPCTAVNEIFGLPYNNDVDVSVAVHNIGGGVLLLDGADLHTNAAHSAGATGGKFPFSRAAEATAHAAQAPTSQAQNENCGSIPFHNNDDFNADIKMPTSSEKIYRRRRRGRRFELEPTSTSSRSMLLTSSEEDRTIQNFHSQQFLHENNNHNQIIVVRNNAQNVNHHGIPLPSSSYADAVRNSKMRQQQNHQQQLATPISLALQIMPDFEQGHQISPTSNLIPPSAIEAHARDFGLQLKPSHEHVIQQSTSSCIVLDSYLDNIITNVPQLGVYLKQQNILQGIHLLSTDDIPKLSSSQLKEGGLTTTQSSNDVLIHPFIHNSARKHDLSPEVVESNAAMLLQFLKTHCFRENSTYLLRRAAGETNIQLFDISSLSAQRHRRWMWWLAMMSYRFGLRLKQLIERSRPNVHVGDVTSPSTITSGERRNFRDRMRSLFVNSIELLHEVADMDGSSHETICAALCGHIADSFLNNEDIAFASTTSKNNEGSSTTFFRPKEIHSQKLYCNVNVDGLSKAQDHLIKGIYELQPALAKYPSVGRMMDSMKMEIYNQMYQLHYKLIYVTLRLAEHHLGSYWSSSAMQALRLASRKIADAIKLVMESGLVEVETETVTALQSSFLQQIGVLRLNCANFARSFAADELWRERGAACGEDVISLLRDVELAIGYLSHYLIQQLNPDKKQNPSDGQKVEYPSLAKKSGGLVGDLNYLSGIVPVIDGHQIDEKTNSCPSIERANWILEKQRLISRENRRVLVAASVFYSHSFDIFILLLDIQKKREDSTSNSFVKSFMTLIAQRYGDTCNEIGSIMLKEINRDAHSNTHKAALATLLLSAEFWFKEGLHNFTLCGDKKNVALLRCNLSQCCKTHANMKENPEKDLETAAKHLELAHEVLEQKEPSNEIIWNNVSIELANIFLVLGVKRRRGVLSQLESINATKQLNPGSERSIVQPLQRALDIYQALNKSHQFAATNYQLGVFYSQIWKFQRDEMKTREKLSSAFKCLSTAHQYFSTNITSKEPTFVLVSLDLSNLYKSVSGLEKALQFCLGTIDAFSPAAIEASTLRCNVGWFNEMKGLEKKVKDALLSVLLSLAKTVPIELWKEMYRLALTWKLENEDESTQHFAIYNLLKKVADLSHNQLNYNT